MADQAARQLQYEYKANSNLVLQVLLVGSNNMKRLKLKQRHKMELKEENKECLPNFTLTHLCLGRFAVGGETREGGGYW